MVLLKHVVMKECVIIVDWKICKKTLHANQGQSMSHPSTSKVWVIWCKFTVFVLDILANLIHYLSFNSNDGKNGLIHTLVIYRERKRERDIDKIGNQCTYKRSINKWSYESPNYPTNGMVINYVFTFRSCLIKSKPDEGSKSGSWNHMIVNERKC